MRQKNENNTNKNELKPYLIIISLLPPFCFFSFIFLFGVLILVSTSCPFINISTSSAQGKLWPPSLCNLCCVNHMLQNDIRENMFQFSNIQLLRNATNQFRFLLHIAPTLCLKCICNLIQIRSIVSRIHYTRCRRRVSHSICTFNKFPRYRRNVTQKRHCKGKCRN